MPTSSVVKTIQLSMVQKAERLFRLFTQASGDGNAHATARAEAVRSKCGNAGESRCRHAHERPSFLSSAPVLPSTNHFILPYQPDYSPTYQHGCLHCLPARCCSGTSRVLAPSLRHGIVSAVPPPAPALTPSARLRLQVGSHHVGDVDAGEAARQVEERHVEVDQNFLLLALIELHGRHRLNLEVLRKVGYKEVGHDQRRNE
eukprot:6181592-Pleurochrysis_carterae.AAC.1